VTVNVEEAPTVTDPGLNTTEIPDTAGDVNDNATICAAPDVSAVLIADVPDDPCPTLTDDGDAPIEKSFGGGVVTVRVTVVVWVAEEPAPVTVNV
jgi:hypothetical protein